MPTISSYSLKTVACIAAKVCGGNVKTPLDRIAPSLMELPHMSTVICLARRNYLLLLFVLNLYSIDTAHKLNDSIKWKYSIK